MGTSSMTSTASNDSSTGLTPATAAALRRLRGVLTTLRDSLGEETTVGQALSFCEVALAREEGITGSELADKYGWSQSTITRNADILGDHGRGNRKGLHLIRRDEVKDRRRKPLCLTAKGARLAELLGRTLVAVVTAGRVM